MKRKSIAAAASALALTMGLAVFAACGGEKETFSAPESVSLSGAVVSWSAVEGAENGYVVKINDDELAVTATSLDLLSDTAVIYLEEGENSVAVKVSATESMNESAWSDSVTYTYTPAPVTDPDREAADKFIAQVEAIGDVKADGAGDKIAAAVAAYEALSDEAKAMAADAKAALDQKCADYDAYMDVKEEVDGFVAQVNAIDVRASDANEKIAAAEAAYTALSDEAKALVTAENATLAAKKAAVAFIALVNGLGDVTATDAGEKIAAAEAAYTALSDEAKALVTAENATLVAKKAAVAFIAQVNEIGDVKADGAGEKIEAAEAAYKALTPEMQEAVKAANDTLVAKRAEYDQYVQDREAADKFIAQVEAIGDVKADGAGDKIAAAVAAYEALTDEAQKMAADAKAALDQKHADYNAYQQVKAEADAFVTKVNAIDVNAADAAEKIAEAEAAYTDLSAEAKALVEVENATLAAKKAAQAFVAMVNAIDVNDDGAEASLAAAEAAYTDLSDEAKTFAGEAKTALEGKQQAYAIAQALAALQEKYQAVTDAGEDNEGVIVAANAALDTYNAFAQYIKDDEDIVALKALIDTALGNAKTAIEDVVDELEGDIRTALDEKTDPSQENYDALLVLAERVEALGEYAQSVFDDTLSTALDAAAATMLVTPVADKTVAHEAYSASGAHLTITILRQYFNFQGKAIEIEAPAVSVSLTTKNEADSDTTTTTSEATFVYDGETGFYAAQIIDADVYNTITAYSYTVAGEETVEKTFTGWSQGAIYFAAEAPYPAQDENGNFRFYTDANASNVTFYLDVYDAQNVASGDTFITYKAKAIASKIELTGTSMTQEEFYRLLANHCPDLIGAKDVQVRLVVYGQEKESGAFSAIDVRQLSEIITLNLTEADKYYSLPNDILENAVDAEGVFNLFTPGRVNELYTVINSVLGENTITESNAAEYLCVKIEVFESGADKAVFVDQAPLTFRGYNLSEMIAAWSYKYFTDNGDVEVPTYNGITIRISFAWTSAANETMKTMFPSAESIEVSLGDEQKNVTLDKDLLTLPDTMAIRLNAAGTDFEFLRDGGAELIVNQDATHAEIKLYQLSGDEQINVQYAYIVIETIGGEQRAVVYKNFDEIGTDTAAKLVLTNLYTDAYCSKSDFATFLLTHYTVNGQPLRLDRNWYLTSRYIIDSENSESYLFQCDFNAEALFFPAPAATAVPTQAQMSFQDDNFVLFVRGETTLENGTIFTNGDIEYVEIHFYAGDTDETNYVLYLIGSEFASGALKLCYKSEDSFIELGSCDTVANGWMTADAFNAALNTYLAAMGVEDTVDYRTAGYTWYTVAVAVEDSVIYNTSSGVSETFTYTAPSTEEEA